MLATASNLLAPGMLPTQKLWASRVPWPAQPNGCVRGFLAPGRHAPRPRRAPFREPRPAPRRNRHRRCWAPLHGEPPTQGCSRASQRCCWAPLPTIAWLEVGLMQQQDPTTTPRDHREKINAPHHGLKPPQYQAPPHHCHGTTGCDPKNGQSESCNLLAAIDFGTWET